MLEVTNVTENTVLETEEHTLAIRTTYCFADVCRVLRGKKN
jgi:hypothetical protein